MKLEICCGSYEDGVSAYRAGAERIELNSALSLGGLTPSLGTLRLLKRDTNLEIICMVRNRGGGFCYSEAEYQIMMEDARILLENGASGIAFGFLNPDFTVNIEHTQQMVQLIHSYGKQAIFHRAFDLVKDIDATVQSLVDCGVDRILTSGQQPQADKGIDMITYLEKNYGDVIEILAGCGVNENNVNLFKEHGIQQIHSSCKSYRIDETSKKDAVSFEYQRNGYEIVDEERVKTMLHLCK